METFGDRLKSERQEYGLNRDAVARILHVDKDRIRALERNDFDAMPDEEALRILRKYAECLSVDAELMIEDYRREREQCLRRLEEAITGPVVEPALAKTPSRIERERRLPIWFVPALLLATVTILGWWFLPGEGTSTAPLQPITVTPVETTPRVSDESHVTVPVETRATPSESRAEAPPAVTTPAPERSPTPSAASLSGLSVAEFGVGTAIENRQLVGRSDRFAEGTQVRFWTDVRGGARGERIEHVWLREGVEAARIPLRLGGPRWRTHSAKTLHAGSSGAWAVEARDASGDVLARAEFACLP